jgi:hypothetical protein
VPAILCRPSCAGHPMPAIPMLAIPCRPFCAGHPVLTILCWPSCADHLVLAILCRPSCADHLVPAILCRPSPCRPSHAGHPMPLIHAVMLHLFLATPPRPTIYIHSTPYTTNPSTYYTIYMTIAYVYCRPAHMDWCQSHLGPPICTPIFGH